MKLASLLLPAVALLVVGSWAGPQRRSITALQTECMRLRNTIAAAKSSSLVNPVRRDPLETRRKIIEWTNIFSMASK